MAHSGEGRGRVDAEGGPGRGRGSLQLQRPSPSVLLRTKQIRSLRLGPRFPTPPPELWASLVAQIVKNPPVRQESWIRFLGRKDPLEEEIATHSGIFA